MSGAVTLPPPPHMPLWCADTRFLHFTALYTMITVVYTCVSLVYVIIQCFHWYQMTVLLDWIGFSIIVH